MIKKKENHTKKNFTTVKIQGKTDQQPSIRTADSPTVVVGRISSHLTRLGMQIRLSPNLP